jgi:hypothetical protein
VRVDKGNGTFVKTVCIVFSKREDDGDDEDGNDPFDMGVTHFLNIGNATRKRTG